MGAPDDKVVEIFVGGSWVDITAYVDWSAGLTTQFGRTSPFTAPQSAAMTLTLDNTDGRFSPLRQVLADGVTAHPYYPNLVPRVPIRFAWIMSGTRYYRFTGLIKGWPPVYKDQARPRVTISATDQATQLAGVTMRPALTQELLDDSPIVWWPLTDPSGSTQAAEQSGQRSGAGPLTIAGTGTAPTFGDNGPGFGDGSGVKFAGGKYLTATTTATNLAFETSAINTVVAWFNLSAYPASDAMIVNTGEEFTGINYIGVDSSGHAVLMLDGTRTVDTPVLALNQWHMLALQYDIATNRAILWVDGASRLAGSTIGFFAFGEPGQTVIGQTVAGPAITGNIGQVALYTAELADARIVAQWNGGNGWVGETVDERIARYLGYAGLTSGDYTLDASAITLNTSPQGGANPFTASQDLGDTEGAGSAVFVDSTGLVRFLSRSTTQKAITPTLTLDAAGDLDAGTWSPAFDADTLINSSAGTRASESGTDSTQLVTDSTSIATFGPTSGDFTSYSDDDNDVLFNAQYRVTGNKNPQFRLGQVAVDLYTAQTAGLYAAVGGTTIGSRLRITNVPPGGGPVGQIDLIVQGWSDNINDSQCTVTFDTTPADAPPPIVWDDTSYGRWQCDGQTLDANITAAATSLVIDTAGGKPTFTTNAAMYPLKIVIGQEHITLNTAPSGSTSPQTFTGVTRGVDGTVAAAQTAGSTINLVPASAWAL